MHELERYGVIPGRWYFDEERASLALLTDVWAIELHLTAQQVQVLKEQMEKARTYVGRQWRNGVLCIPAKEHKE